MPGFEYGFNRAVRSFLAGILTGFILKTFLPTGFIDEHLILTFSILAGLASVVDTLTKIKYWSTAYILGFILGYSLVSYMFGFDIFVLIMLSYSVYIIVKRMFSKS